VRYGVRWKPNKQSISFSQWIDGASPLGMGNFSLAMMGTYRLGYDVGFKGGYFSTRICWMKGGLIHWVRPYGSNCMATIGYDLLWLCLTMTRASSYDLTFSSSMTVLWLWLAMTDYDWFAITGVIGYDWWAIWLTLTPGTHWYEWMAIVVYEKWKMLGLQWLVGYKYWAMMC